MTRTLIRIGVVVVSLGSFSCGMSPEGLNQSSASSTVPYQDSADTDGLFFRGAVVSAFEVVVDGVRYKDMEQFYTAEQGRLSKKFLDAGYPSASHVRFEAELGFLDLWRHMNVFVLAEGNTGYMASGRVESNGSFAIKLPLDAVGDSYRVRANKRIKVKFQTAEVLHTFCYNFSAVQQSVDFESISKPIVLNSFESSLTTYDCPAEEAVSSLKIPPSSSNAELGKIAVGMTKSQVSTVLGVSGLTILDATTWCYAPAQTDNVCAISYQNTTCRCSLVFDAQGLFKSQTNLSPSRLSSGL
jgi:hypothetical protein